MNLETIRKVNGRPTFSREKQGNPRYLEVEYPGFSG